MEEKIIQKNTYLNLHPLIQERPKFWQSCFDQKFEDDSSCRIQQAKIWNSNETWRIHSHIYSFICPLIRIVSNMR